MNLLLLPLLLVLPTTILTSEKKTDSLLSRMKTNVRLSYAAYCQPQDIESWKCYWCERSDFKFDKLNYYHEPTNDLLFYVAKHYDTLYLIYRGTPDPEKKFWDWIDDFDFVQVETQYGPSDIKLHKGFWEMFMSMKNETVKLVNEYLDNYSEITKIEILGHSLGCSLAHLAAFVLLVDGSDRYREINGNGELEIMTFAAPRTGNDAFVNYFISKYDKERIFRVVNQRDLVTSLPPEFTLYHHLPTEYWFKDAACCDYITCDGSGEDPACSDSVTKWSIPDHITYLNYSLLDAAWAPYNCWG